MNEFTALMVDGKEAIGMRVKILLARETVPLNNKVEKVQVV